MELKILPLEQQDQKAIPKQLGFGTSFSNRMFEQEYSAGTGWHEATIGPYRPLSLDPATAVLHYAQEIFDGTKAYRRPDGGVNLFRPWENVKRFNASATRMAMPTLDENDHLEAIVKLVELESDWVPHQEGAALYIRPFMFASQVALGVGASTDYKHLVILSPVGPYFKGGFAPVSVFISNDHRRAVKGGVGAAKTGGNYAASLMVGEQAKAQGYAQVLWLDAIEGRFVEEVGAMNICFVYADGRIVTPPLSGSILPGITRDSVITLGRALGYDVSESAVEVNDTLADIESGNIVEVFGCGTAAVIAPVGRFGYKGQDYVISDERVGPVTTRLYDELTGIQYGRKEDRFGWTQTIAV